MVAPSLSDKDVRAALQALEQVTDEQEAQAWRVGHLGKKGAVTLALRALSALPLQERKAQGRRLNEARQRLDEAYRARVAALQNKQPSEEADWSLPITDTPMGSFHPIEQVMGEIRAFFLGQGFAFADGPQIEDEEHNFCALNMPEDHPARQMHDTFYVQGGTRLLRTHTSSVQVRAMRARQVKEGGLYMFSAGPVYRRDYDQTHTPMFHQVEGLAVDKALDMGHLKGCLLAFCRSFFGGDVALRFRPSFFPFTEPSAEVDIAFSRTDKEGGLGGVGGEGGLRLGGDEWMEILGCGMVHPKVLQACDIDSSQWRGFAFGMGVERLAMLKYGMRDLRMFFDSDMRWLQHYGFHPFAAVP
ncbi:MAG: phenylalanine--tRNA ligase subunit alpha [Alphaproteobacteria bacterium GM202ARS2]|nr:phenylalanine--tRNA ligase subunit alpha [Alphaproteobacteria bacterium GM202ARS2]